MSLPTLAQFRSAFPELSAASDLTVQTSLQAQSGTSETLWGSDYVSLVLNLAAIPVATGLVKSTRTYVAVVDSLVQARANTAAPSTYTAAQVDSRVAQPDSNPQAAGYALSAADIGQVVFASGAGAQAFTLPSLAAALISGRALLLTIQCTGNATAVTITPASGVQIDNAGSGVAFAAAVGRTRISLVSKDGLNWYSGA